jgi:hypothetical protein
VRVDRAVCGHQDVQYLHNLYRWWIDTGAVCEIRCCQLCWAAAACGYHHWSGLSAWHSPLVPEEDVE